MCDEVEEIIPHIVKRSPDSALLSSYGRKNNTVLCKKKNRFSLNKKYKHKTNETKIWNHIKPL